MTLTSARAIDKYRPLYHFTPASGWCNDPNGLLFDETAAQYHLFYQYYPHATVWGPMHWGHAVSRNLISWEHLPVALEPDEKGWIFSGSAVIDRRNTTGLLPTGSGNSNDRAPMVALFTYHDPVKADAGTKDHESQGLAWFVDRGSTWKKHGIVIPNPGNLPDFRDPKVMWDAIRNAWVMVLAAGDRVLFYSSPDLRNWSPAGEFTAPTGSTRGVWECPDLFPLELNGETIWVLILSTNPGGPNGGSGTRYYLGSFDGESFSTKDYKTRWLNYGPDHYAGVSFHGTREVTLMAWMSNWSYGQKTPSKGWRGTMSLPVILSLTSIDGDVHLSQRPVPSIDAAFGLESEIVGSSTFPASGAARLRIRSSAASDWKLQLRNSSNEFLVIVFEAKRSRFVIDRSNCKPSNFHPPFMKPILVNRTTNLPTISMTLYFDVTSVELFANQGTVTAAALFFSEAPWERVDLFGAGTRATLSALA